MGTGDSLPLQASLARILYSKNLILIPQVDQLDLPIEHDTRTLQSGRTCPVMHCSDTWLNKVHILLLWPHDSSGYFINDKCF